MRYLRRENYKNYYETITYKYMFERMIFMLFIMSVVAVSAIIVSDLQDFIEKNNNYKID